jgi:hypothetical protein
MITVTLQHSKNNPLIDLITAIKGAWRGLTSGRWYQDFASTWGIIGTVKGVEITYGDHGWHPHFHILVFTRLSDSDLMPDLIREHVSARWVDMLKRRGFYASDDAGVDVVVGDGQAARYVSKWGLDDEVTKTPVKVARQGSVTPFGLLDLYISGEAWAGDKFIEYATATEGLRQLRYSAGLRDLLGMGIESTDEDLAEAPSDTDDVIFGVLSWRDWFDYLKIKKHPAELIEVLHTGNRDALLVYLAAHNIHNINPDVFFTEV